MRYRQVVQPALRAMVYEEFAPNDAWCCGPGDGDDWLSGRHGGDATSLASLDGLFPDHRLVWRQTDAGPILTLSHAAEARR